MKKAILLSAAMSFAVPAFAQAPQAAPQASPMTQTAPAPSTAPAATDPSAAAPAQTAPAAPADSAQAQAPAQTTGESATQTAQQPAAGGTQVAQVVDSEFATYDKDKNGVLSKAEFGDWMIALKSASDPSTKPEAAATKTWVGQAFASADTDKSRTVSKTELTGFLSKGQS